MLYRIILLIFTILKSLILNIRLFPIKTAIKFPIICSPFVKIKSLKGKIIIDTKNIKRGMIRIGLGNIGIFDQFFSRSILEIKGKVIFKGDAYIGQGSKISVGETGVLKIGDNFNITAETEIVCHKEISFGNNVLISWNSLIMDTDFHRIYSSKFQKQMDYSKKIVIEDNVWIGCRNTILKGSKIKKGSVIGANSLVVNEFQEENVLIVGNPAQIKKKNIYWEK